METLKEWLKNTYELSQATGLKFALKYKLGIAEEGIDYTACGVHDECWNCPEYIIGNTDRKSEDCAVIQSARKKRRSRLIKTFKMFNDLQ